MFDGRFESRFRSSVARSRCSGFECLDAIHLFELALLRRVQGRCRCLFRALFVFVSLLFQFVRFLGNASRRSYFLKSIKTTAIETYATLHHQPLQTIRLCPFVKKVGFYGMYSPYSSPYAASSYGGAYGSSAYGGAPFASPYASSPYSSGAAGAYGAPYSRFGSYDRFGEYGGERGWPAPAAALANERGAPGVVDRVHGGFATVGGFTEAMARITGMLDHNWQSLFHSFTSVVRLVDGFRIMRSEFWALLKGLYHGRYVRVCDC